MLLDEIHVYVFGFTGLLAYSQLFRLSKGGKCEAFPECISLWDTLLSLSLFNGKFLYQVPGKSLLK